MSTRSDIEKALVSRAGRRMALVEMAISTAGANTDLQDPIATALRDMGLNANDPVTDDNIAAVGQEGFNELLDRAEYRLLENITGNLTLVNISVGARSQSLGQIATQIESDLQRLGRRIEQKYGALSALSVGSISLDFQAKG